MEANVHAKYKAIIMLARFSGLLVLCSSTSSMGAFTMERRSTIVYPVITFVYLFVNIVTHLTLTTVVSQSPQPYHCAMYVM